MPTTLTAGDIALIGFNAVSSPPQTYDEFTFVLLKDLEAGTVIKFTDNAWQSSDNTFKADSTTSAGIFTWTAPSNQTKAGTVIQVSLPTGTGNPEVNANGDQIIAYQDTSGSPVFIYALNNAGSDWLTSGTVGSTTSYIPQNLSNGTTAIALVYSTNNRNAYYDTTKAGTLTSGTKEQLLTSISNKANWTGANARFTNLSALVPTSFTVVSDTTPPTADIVDIMPDPRNTNAGTVTIDFSENVTGVDITDFTLTKDGIPVILSGSVTSVSAKKYTLDLSNVTTTDGSYNLVLSANSTIQDLANNILTTSASDTWRMDSTLPTADIIDVTPDPRNTAVGTVTVDFNEDVTGVDITDFTLAKDGVPVPLTGIAVTKSAVDPTLYTLDLTNVTNAAGNYVFTLNTSDIKDLANNPLAASVNDTWSFVSAPTADIIDIAPDPRNTAVGVVTVDFSQEVSNVDITDFALTRDNQLVPLTGIAVTKSAVDPTLYTLNLSNVTTTDGTYIFTLNPSDIKDAANNTLVGSVSDTWFTDSTTPTADIVDITPDPRNTNAGTVTVNFSENVTGVDIADFTLTRDNIPVNISGLSVTQVNAKQYTLNLSSVTATSGNYVLSLNAANSGIKDGVNNSFAVNATDAWVTDSTLPTVDIVDITPDPRNMAVGEVTVNFSENVTGVDIADFSLTRDGTPVTLAGSVTQVNPQQYTLNLTNFTATSGNYQLKLKAGTSGIQDAVNNPLTTDAIDSWVTDSTVPTADIIDVSPDPRNNAVGLVTVNFTENVTGVDIGDFTLTRDGTNVNIASVPFAQVNPQQYTLNLTSVSATSGNYVLSLNAAISGIQDSTINLFATSVTDSWLTDTTGVSADIVDVTPDPRNSSVGMVNINFNTNVTGVDIADFALTLDNTPIDISSLSVAGNGNQYSLNLSGVTTTVGNYVLTLKAQGSGIQDSLNNVLSVDSSDTWVLDKTAPVASTFSPADDSTNVPVGNDLSLTFDEAIQKGMGNVTIKKVSDDSVVQTIDVTTGAATVSGSTLTINPPANLDITTEYYVDVAGGTIKDLAGNDFAGITDKTVWTFTTASTVETPTGGGSSGGGSSGGGSSGGGSSGGGSSGGGSSGGGSTGGNSGNTPAVPTPAVPTPAVPTPAVPAPAVPTPGVPAPAVPNVHGDLQANPITEIRAGGDTDDVLVGNAEANQFLGLGGQDILVGLAGNDNLFGNGGDDLIFGNHGTDYMDGGKGRDILFAGKDDDAVKGGADDDILMGDIGNDRLAGEGGNDILFGNVGEDCLDGGEGDDLLFGGHGHDTVIGGLGNDILSGDLGDDLLTGGAGGDRFDFRIDDGINIITDFTDGQDIIGLRGGLTYDRLTIAQVGNETQITATGLSIRLQGVNSNLIGSSDFALV